MSRQLGYSERTDVNGGGRFYTDNIGTFFVPDNYTAENSPYNPGNPALERPTNAENPAWEDSSVAYKAPTNPLAQALGGSSGSYPAAPPLAPVVGTPNQQRSLLTLYDTFGGSMGDTAENLRNIALPANTQLGYKYTHATGEGADEFNRWLQSSPYYAAPGTGPKTQTYDPSTYVPFEPKVVNGRTVDPLAQALSAPADPYALPWNQQQAAAANPPAASMPAAPPTSLTGRTSTLEEMNQERARFGQPTITEAEYRRLVNSGQLPPNDKRAVVEEYGNVNSNAGPRSTATPPALPNDLIDALRQLMEDSRTQGLRGQQNLEGVLADIRNQLNFSRDATTQTMGRQDELINSLLGRITPALDDAFAGANTKEGLSPEALAAMRTQAVEGTQRDYQGNVEALKTELARRGAAGGMTPAVLDELVRGYGNLQASRDASRSKQLQDVILADEQRKFESLGLNRQREANALGTAAGLTGTVGSVYNPGQFLGASGDALSQLTGALGAQNAAGMNAIGQAGNIAGTLADLQPTSTATLLKNALLGTGFSTLQSLLTGGTKDQIGSVIDKILGGLKKPSGNEDPDTGGPDGGDDTATTGGGLLATIGAALPTVATVAAPVFAALGVAQLVKILNYSDNDVANMWTPVQTAFGQDLAKIVDAPGDPAQKLAQVQDMWAKFNQVASQFAGTIPQDREKIKARFPNISDNVLNRLTTGETTFAKIIRQMHQHLDPIMAKIIGDLGGGNA